MKEVKNKVLVGVVTADIKDYCWDKFSRQLKGLQMQGCDVYITDNSRTTTNRKGFKVWNYKYEMPIIKAIAEQGGNYLTYVMRDCMNELRRYFLAGDYTHLFILESDVLIAKDSLQRLLDMDSDVANFTYLMNLQRFNTPSLCIQSKDDNDVARMITPEDSKKLLNTGIKTLNVDKLGNKTLSHCGYGCTLVKRNVIEKIEFRTGMSKVNDKVHNPFPDSFFHQDVNKLGFTNKLDTDYIPHHINLNDETLDSMKVKQIQSKTSRRERRAKKR